MAKGYRCVGIDNVSDFQARNRSEFFYWSGRAANGSNSVKGQPLRLNTYSMVDFNIRGNGARNAYDSYYRHPIDFGSPRTFTGKWKYIYFPGPNVNFPSKWNGKRSISLSIPTLTKNEKNLMRADLQNQISRTTMELAVSLKEVPETVRMMLSGFQRLNNVFIAASRKDFSGMADALGVKKQRSFRRRWKKHLERQYYSRPGPKDSINGLSGIYLEGVFGYWSAYKEIIATAEFLADLVHNLPRERAYADGPTFSEMIAEPGYENSSSDFIGFTHGSSVTTTRMNAQYKVSWSTVITSAGLNISAIWQIIPYSFIVNWFADITSFLKQFELLNSLSELECTLTCVKRVNLSFTGTARSFKEGTNGYEYTIAPINSSFDFVYENRSLESLTITAPPIKLPEKTGQYISAIALIAQRITGR